MNYKKVFGLIGKKLDHSFSPDYFNTKFQKENIKNAEYQKFPLEDIALFPALLQQYPSLRGLNVTVPYKESVIPYLQTLAPSAAAVGAVNTIEFLPDGTLKGHNTDIDGFLYSLLLIQVFHNYLTDALVLGTGGAAKAVCHVLKTRGINYQLVSRTAAEGQLSYEMLDKAILDRHLLLINTTPLGMYPNIESAAPIPFHYLTKKHVLIDLIYNPVETTWLRNGKKYGAFTENGLIMLKQQAEKAWEIWNNKSV